MNLELRPRLRFYGILLVLLVVWLRINLLRLLRPLLPASGFEKLARRIHERNARHLYRMILKRRGLMIKVGQFMSLRVDLLPRMYTRTLARLQDQVPPVPYSKIRKVLLEELGRPPEEVFEDFSPEPIAAASLGQVHEARLPGHGRVAVKVQYPGMEKIVDVDLRILGILLRFWKRFRKTFDNETILGEFRAMVTQELDYLNEAANAERVAGLFRDDPDILIPRVIHLHTTRRVLVMEYLDGIKITDLEALRAAGIDVRAVSERVVDCYMRQLIRHGFFQADAHPGNLFVQPGPRIVMVDFGLCKGLSPDFRRGFVNLAAALVQRDPAQMGKAFVELGFRTLDGDENASERFAEVVVHNIRELLYRNRKKVPYLKIFQQISEVVREHPIVSIPSDFIFIGRILAQLTGLGRQLGQRIEVNRIAARYLMPPGVSVGDI